MLIDIKNHNSLAGYLADEHIDWTNSSQDLKTTGKISFGTSLNGVFVIQVHTEYPNSIITIFDENFPRDARIIDIWNINNGDVAASTTLKDGDDNIIVPSTLVVAGNSIVRPVTLYNEYATLAAGDSLVNVTGGKGQFDYELFILCVGL